MAQIKFYQGLLISIVMVHMALILMMLTQKGLRNWVEKIPSEGVTALLPTTITQSELVLTRALENVAQVVEEGYTGAEILGVHFEGPYLDMQYKGAQPEQYIVKPTVEQFKKYQEAAKGLIKYITMATETDDNFELTRLLYRKRCCCKYWSLSCHF